MELSDLMIGSLRAMPLNQVTQPGAKPAHRHQRPHSIRIFLFLRLIIVVIMVIVVIMAIRGILLRTSPHRSAPIIIHHHSTSLTTINVLDTNTSMSRPARGTWTAARNEMWKLCERMWKVSNTCSRRILVLSRPVINIHDSSTLLLVTSHVTE